MDVEWERVVVRKNKAWDPKRAIQKEFMHEPEPPPDRTMEQAIAATTYVADAAYKGAHHDHFAHFFNAIRGARDVGRRGRGVRLPRGGAGAGLQPELLREARHRAGTRWR